jgi:hypothetical protein
VESVLAVLIGIGLAASCGFRVFVPMLVTSIAVKTGQLQLADGFAWLGSWPALIAFAVATVLEIAAYYVPWLDNLLDLLILPAAAVAGAILMAAMVAEFSPLLQWSLAIIAGAGAAATVQSVTMFTRGASTSTSGGIANPAVATIENISSLVFFCLSLLAPAIAVVLLIAAIGTIFYVSRRLLVRQVGSDSPQIPCS